MSLLKTVHQPDRTAWLIPRHSFEASKQLGHTQHAPEVLPSQLCDECCEAIAGDGICDDSGARVRSQHHRRLQCNVPVAVDLTPA